MRRRNYKCEEVDDTAGLRMRATGRIWREWIWSD
jgi:hypothetical protein